ncbi:MULTISPECIES: tyrosine-type recombinase/integrase [Amylolactobacillus]|uniref:Uncharacterized protein n=3 Tax=Amylolactobacillus TaxID=2767876 RepID=A0A1L6XAM3_9LACO|nr:MULTISPECIES: site-specific integrase [Amylolactobacillus]APT18031.1 hypothetical protein LA20533_01295 [Amylolactobacillus amylophilus DSM 20533 = JCM 1125]KRM41722.1 hypothetical protein FD40_GL001285 [Amylolactobacillus amylophilus DSM 20533 = JCM 1125]GED80681.1 site-specific integrase [Amylolactobacillus amylophilus]
MAKRTNSAIFEYQNKNGQTLYGFYIYLGTDKLTKKKINTKRRGFKSYNEANAVFNKMKVDGIQSKVNDEITIEELFKLWFESYKISVKESTANKTQQVFDHHIKPTLGKYYINEITTPIIQQLVDRKAKEIVKFKIIYNYLNRMYTFAVTMDLATGNPVTNVILPKKSTRLHRDTEHNFYNKQELIEFLETAKSINQRVYVYFLLLASTGLRRSEALALTWKDIDFTTKTIDINKTLTSGFNNKLIVGSPKSTKSKRTVPISDNLLTELRKYKLANAEFDKLFHTYKDTYVSLSKPAQWLRQVYDKNKSLRHITTHRFRHTFASLLFESNPNIKPTDVQKILGHETVEMTLNIYTHVTSDSEARVTNAINLLNF